MKIWLDDIRPAPLGYTHCYSVNEAKKVILNCHCEIDIIDCDHDLGDYAYDGGDGINLLNWLEETGRNYKIKLHTMNPVGKDRMQMIIDKNGWY